MTSNSDPNLLFGIIALQMDFIQREQLVVATSSWLTEKSRNLDEILIEQGALSESDRDLLAPLVARHLENHDGDAARSLAALSSIGSVADDLRSLGDEMIDATLSVVSAASEAEMADSSSVDGVERPSESGPRFRVLRPHAKGGLGEVSVAKDIELNRDVALKEIQERYADDESSRSRFVLEAEVTGGLEHPGIVPVYGLGRYDDGRPFYAMRFVKGDSLQEAAERMYAAGPVDYNSVEFRKLLGRFIDVCEAIEYAHSRGVLHRDLKPGNIMLGKYGETLVVDWGLAKVKERDEQASFSDEQTLRPSSGSGAAPTQMGSAIGTPAFMPPEQAIGNLDQLGPASDVYSLGATLYYVLTAQRPFAAGDLNKVLEAVKGGHFPPPQTIKPTIPKPLAAICLKAMSLKPSDRYGAPMQLADDVQRWLGDEPVSAYAEPYFAQVQRWVRRHQTLAASFTALLFTALVALAVGTLLISRAQQETADALVNEKLARGEADDQRDIANREREEADVQRAIAESALRKNQVISANLAFDRARQLSEEGQPDIGFNWFVRAMELAPKDDKAFQDLIRANLEEWKTEIVTRRQYFRLDRGGFPAGAKLTRDGTRLFIGHPDIGVIQWDTFSAEPTLLRFPGVEATLSSEFTGGLLLSGAVALSPDETICAAGLEKNVHFWNLSDGSPIGDPITVDAAIMSLGFHPDGQSIAIGCTDGKCHVYDVKTRQARGKAMVHGARIISVTFHPDGQKLLTAGYDSRVRRWDVSSHEEIEPALTHARMGLTAAIWSTDGKRIFACDMSGLKVWDVDSNKAILDFETNGAVLSINLSPDGQRLAFGVEDGTVRIWDAASLKPLYHPLLLNDAAHFVAFDESRRQLFTLAADPVLTRWVFPKNPILASDSRDVDSNRVAVDPSGHKIAFGGMRGNLVLCELKTGEQMREPLNFEEPIASVNFNRSGDLLLVTGFRGSSRVYETKELEQVGSTLTVKGAAMGGSFVNNGQVAIAAMQEGLIRIFDVQTGESVGADVEQVLAARVDVFGDHMVVGAMNKKIKVWSLKSRAELTPTIEELGEILAVRHSPDGRLYAACGMNRAANVWKVGSVEPFQVFPHASAVKDVSFSVDNRLFATSGADHRVRLWHLATGKRVGPWRDGFNLNAAQFDSKDQLVMVWQTGAAAARTLTWERPPEVMGDVEKLRLWATVETGIELQAGGNYRVLPWEPWNEAAEQLNESPPVIED